uniref:Uncharacterized protein n=1 Tax=Sphaerodactylus townsendi TaxID=933632 RepID=A0ACB8G9N8_9SAUR
MRYAAQPGGKNPAGEQSLFCEDNDTGELVDDGGVDLYDEEHDNEVRVHVVIVRSKQSHEDRHRRGDHLLDSFYCNDNRIRHISYDLKKKKRLRLDDGSSGDDVYDFGGDSPVLKFLLKYDSKSKILKNLNSET